jgi:hypothetical protein
MERAPVTFEEMETALRQRLKALPPAARAELLHGRAFAELLIDLEEDRTLRAVLVGMLRERAEDILTRRRGRQKAGAYER